MWAAGAGRVAPGTKVSAVIEEEGILAALGTKMDRLSTSSLRVGTDNIILWCEEHTLKRWISNSRREDDS